MASVTGGDGGIDEIDLDASGRYLRLQRATDYGYSLWSLEVY